MRPQTGATYSGTVPNQVRIIKVEELYPRSIRRTSGVEADEHVLAITFKVKSGTDRGYTFDAEDDAGVPSSMGSATGNSIGAGGEITIYFTIASGVAGSGNKIKIVESVPEHPPTPSYSNTYNTAVSATRHNCDDSALDTRTGYGQPNREGQLPADPNAELRNIKFGTWVFSGGLFAGNMAAGTKDRSGTARMQFWPPSNVTSITPSGTDPDLGGPLFYTLTLFDLDKPALGSGLGTVGSPLLGVWGRAVTDANSGSTETTVSWATRWLSITMEDHGSSSGPGTYDQDWRMARYIRGTTAYGSEVGPYVNWPLTLTSMSVSDGADAYDNLPYQLGLTVGLVEEEEQVSTTVWRYFASREFEALQTTFPKTDSRPRIWCVGGAAGPVNN